MSPRVAVIGSGLIGTSVGLALSAAGWEVLLDDANPAAVAAAAERGAGTPLTQDSPPPDLVVVAVPPHRVADVVVTALERWPVAVVTDVASVKVPVLSQVAGSAGAAVQRFVGGHPMAGREVSGPAGALPELFRDRAWVLTPIGNLDEKAVELVLSAVAATGAIPVEMTAEEHDQAVALTSHTPQVLASLLAGRLAKAPDEQVMVSGQGLRDTVRIAASDPDLWSEILTANSEPLARELRDLAERLSAFIDDLEAGGGAGREAAYALVADGRTGLHRLPGKHGEEAARYRSVRVAVPDEPGALAALFAVAGKAGVNLEDVRIEHALGRPTGLVELSVAPAQAPLLEDSLVAAGWSLRA